MRERRWKIPALHAALEAAGFQLSRATVYRVLDGQSPPGADLAFWTFQQLDRSLDAELDISAGSAASPQPAGGLEEAVHAAVIRVLGLILRPEALSEALATHGRQSEASSVAPEVHTVVKLPTAMPGDAALSGEVARLDELSTGSARDRLRRASRGLLSSMEPGSPQQATQSNDESAAQRRKAGS